jgi:hypothetical protein
MSGKYVGTSIIIIFLVAVISVVAFVSHNDSSSIAMAESGEAATGGAAAVPPQSADLQHPGHGWAAMEQAAAENKYLFAFFYKAADEQTESMRLVFEKSAQQVAGRANAVSIDVTSPAERQIVEKFNVSRAPMPLVLALAPNGAVTGGFPAKFTEQQLLGALVSPAAADCLGALQGGRLVFLCLQNGDTRFNSEAMAGIRAFTADDRFTKATEVVTIDPTDPGEAQFLKNLKVEMQNDSALTIFMAPPGAVLARYSGGTDKEEMVKTLTAALSGSGGCGPGSSSGCCPPKK